MYSVGDQFLPGMAVFITVVLIFWLIGLTFYLWKQRSFFDKAFPKSGERDIRKKFEELIGKVEGFDLQIKSIEQKIIDLETDGLGHIQKVALIRFNPFADSGGDQSFAVALLDKEGNGTVLTSLHGRDSTRVFAKPVVGGKATKYQFSKEEAEVVKEAMKG